MTSKDAAGLQVKVLDRSTSWLLLFAAATVSAWWLRPNNFVSDDSFFYLVVARRLSLEGRQTFSGAFLTNGVHPLWLYVLFLFDRGVELVRPGTLWSLRTFVPLAALLYLAGTVTLIRASRRLNWRPWLVATPVVVYAGFMGILFSEGHALFFFAATLLFVLGASAPFASVPKTLWTGIAMAAVVLARLDSAFFVAAIFAVAFFKWEASRKRLMIAMAVVASTVGAYVATNLIYFDGLVPVSGWMKSSFPVPTVSGFFYGGGLSILFSNYNVVFGWFPIGLAAFTVLGRRDARSSLVFMSLFFGCAAHLMYTALFAAESWWYWYYILDMLLAGISLHYLLQEATDRFTATMSALVVCAAMSVMVTRTVRTDSYATSLNSQVMRFLTVRHIDHKTLLVSEAPGMIAFYTHNNVVSNDLLTGTRSLYRTVASTPNPLQTLLNVCRDARYPVDYIIWNTGTFFQLSADRTSIEWLDPKNGRRHRSFGKLDLAAPEFSSDGLAVWSLPSHVMAAGRSSLE
jgi:hypothetical protein